ncbi:glycoside hydrolase family 2 protein [Marinilabilia sp.]|uniref:beta-mannosidase n=1 Tax=Marinilabilia sp. TaxID=2021252 RepID=UPI0025C29AD7|nr:glycoside hydrolase family 2 protein [Marinilabilia sp.]
MFNVKLDTNWEFSQAALNEWRPASVPGTVHTDLLAQGLIEDPFYRTNERDQQWIDKVDWEYRNRFKVDAEVVSREVVELFFYGIDTYAFVFLNGHMILKTDNMFRHWSINVRRFVVEGENHLHIYFQSPVRKGLSEQKSYGLRLPAANDQSENGGLGPNKVSMFTRKAGYHYGWDWGPRFVTSGIWRPVAINAWDRFDIRDVFVYQKQISPDLADLEFHIELQNIKAHNYSFLIEELSGEFALVPRVIHVDEGNQKIIIPVTINNPRLWWCNGQGNPAMYHFRVTISDENGQEKVHEVRTGLREIKLVREPDNYGESFFFELNGRSVFAKGANYIPNDVFLPRVSEDDYRKVIGDAAAANMNMIRVWGGGIYENDIFYDLCDEMGIMVWQDFMFACSMFPGNDEFLDNVRQEAVENVVRLRNHPSMALWCGNNEIHSMWAWHGDKDPLGWKAMYDGEDRKIINKAYDDLFHSILPDVVAQYGGGIDYWPSSPQAGYDVSEYADEQTLTSGDQHYWGVWHGLHPFSGFDENVGRFMSEYGFQSFPELESVKKYTVPSDLDIESDVMAAHQRSGIGNLRIKEYMERDYRVPQGFEQFLYMSQVLQAEGIKRGIEAHRRNMPRCMGSLYWQLNDCWPVASWASTDYYRKWKALHYAVRRAFEPVLIAPVKEEGELVVYLVSDLQNAFSGTLRLEVVGFSGKKVNSRQYRVDVNPNTSNRVLEVPFEKLMKNASGKETFLHLVLEGNGRAPVYASYFFSSPKEMRLSRNPKIGVSLQERSEDEMEVVLKSKVLVKNLMLSVAGEEVFFSDNCFDLLPGDTRKILIKTNLDRKKLKENLVLRHLMSE